MIVVQGSDEKVSKVLPRRVVPVVLFIAALGIAGVMWLSNASNGSAQECSISAENIAALDEVTIGQMAAVLPTGTGRGYADLAFVDANGAALTLADFAGKPLLVNFWATWCGPCREEMPALNTLAARYGGQNFALLTIDLDVGDDGIEKAKAFLDENGLNNLPLLADPTFAAFDRLKTSGVALGLPATLLLDGAGCELAVLQGPAQWDSQSAFAVIDKLIELVG
jgi:thiol-disulfide isomerase/thioredoxin